MCAGNRNEERTKGVVGLGMLSLVWNDNQRELSVCVYVVICVLCALSTSCWKRSFGQLEESLEVFYTKHIKFST